MGNWVSNYKIANLVDNEVMCGTNVTDMQAFRNFMSDTKEIQRDIDNGAKYKAYILEEMKDG